MRVLVVISVLIFNVQLYSQGSFCDVNGNLMIYSNYDGGVLNINVDQDIPNLKIGIVSYEAVTVTISGTYKNNISGVIYAGYNSNNNHCGSTIATTTITGVSASLVTIQQAPPVTLTNSNGYGSIICGYSCSITTSQGGCNTIDQIEAYMLNQFSNSTLFAHRVQYGCWTGTENVSSGGDCCASITTLTVTAKGIDESCKNACDGTVFLGAAGGTSPYSFTVNGSSNYSNLCNGNYSVVVTDASLSTANASATVGSFGPATPSGDSIQEFCGPSQVKDLLASGSGIAWFTSDTSSQALDSNTVLSNNTEYFAASIVGGCESDKRFKVMVKILVENTSVTVSGNVLTAVVQGANYQWIDCGDNSPITSATNRSFTPQNNGSYAVIITENSCIDTSDCIEINSIGIESNSSDDLFSVFPNPAKDVVNIKSSKSAHIQIFDAKGKLVYNQQMLDTELKIDVQHWDKGVYLIRLSSNGSSTVTKQIVIN